MTQNRPALLCLFTLGLGLSVGAAFQGLLTPPPAQADGITPQRSIPARNTSALLELSEHLPRIASRTNPCVVHIQSEHPDGTGRNVEETGSGVIVRDPQVRGTYVVTNSHVVRGAKYDKISMNLSNGHMVHPTRILEDRATDIAVIEIPTTTLPAAEWGNSDRVQIGNLVMAMGSPFGLSQSVTLGIISAKGRRDLKLSDDQPVINQDFLQTDAAINPGNSGGPLIDLHGQIIGINTAIASNSGGNEGIAFSIPSNLVRRVTGELLRHGKVRRAYLGVRLDDDFGIREARRLGLNTVRGARVVFVYSEPTTPAYRAGLRVDDVVLSFDGIDVVDENHLINLVSLAEVDTHVRLVVLRGRKRFSVELDLTERPTRQRMSTLPADQSGVKKM